MAQLHFYDWEASALTPNGQTGRRPAASRGHQRPCGSARAPAPPPRATRKRAACPYIRRSSSRPCSRRPISSHSARLGPEYYLFGASGSDACAAKARQQGTVPTAGQRCLLAGPDNELYSTSRHEAIQNLASQLPPGVTPADGQVLVVQQGTVILQATNPSAGQTVTFASPQARFFVLRDNVGMWGSDITNPKQSTDQTGSPAVKFGFNRAGKRLFQNMTRQIAHRGQDISTLDQTVNQHFAIALDNQLLAVAPIDYKTYPDGVTSGGGQITRGLTTNTAKHLADELRLGALTVNLKLISSTQIATGHNH